MGDLIKSIAFVIGLTFVFVIGLGIGRDSVRSDIYSACIKNNPEIPNGKIKEFCTARTKEVLSAEVRK